MLIALLAAAAATTTPPSLNFDSKGTMGVSFGFGPPPALPGSTVNVGSTSTFAPVVGVSYFIQDGVAVRAELAFDAILSTGYGPATLTLGLGARMYQFKRDRVAVFLQPSAVLTRYRIGGVTGAPDAAEAVTVALGAGVEYFFADRFSVAGVLALGFTIGNIGGPAGSSATTELNTSTSGLFASFYF